jgi:hypothetical protein
MANTLEVKLVVAALAAGGDFVNDFVAADQAQARGHATGGDD